MKYKFMLLAAVALTISGCGVIKINSGQQQQKTEPPARGVFKTLNRGTAWSALGNVYALKGQTINFGFLNPTFIKQDPQDPNAIYLGTERQGLYYSYNRGEGWFQTVPASGVINDLVVDYRSKCTLYTLIYNQVFKTTDCSRTWQRVHFSSIEGEFYTSISMDVTSNDVLYVTTSKGTLLHSTDAGKSWSVLYYFTYPLQRILVDPKNPNVLYVTSATNGISRSKDGGTSWEPMNMLPVYDRDSKPQLDGSAKATLLKDLPGSNTFFDLKFDSSQGEGLIYASGYGIFRFVNGSYWQEIEILNKPRGEQVYAIAINETNGQDIYFATTGAFYQSHNGGREWSLSGFPATGKPKLLLLSPDNDNELFIGFYAAEKK